MKYSDTNLSGVTISGNTALTDNAGSIGGSAGGAQLHGGTLIDSVVTGNVAGDPAGASRSAGPACGQRRSAATPRTLGRRNDRGPREVLARPPRRFDGERQRRDRVGDAYGGLGGGIAAYSTGKATG